MECTWDHIFGLSLVAMGYCPITKPCHSVSLLSEQPYIWEHTEATFTQQGTSITTEATEWL